MGNYIVRVAEKYYDLEDEEAYDWRGYPIEKIRIIDEYETSTEPDDSVDCHVMSDGYTEVHTVIAGSGSETTEEQEKQFEFPEGIKELRTSTFYGFDNTTFPEHLIIPDSVEKILGDFICSTKVKTVTIGKNVSVMSAYSFHYCHIESIEVHKDNPYYSSKDGVLFDKQGTTLIRCPRCKQGDYVIPNTVTKIGELAFALCGPVVSAIPEGVKEIGAKAFEYCGLRTLTIADSVVSIEDNAFHSCYFESVQLPNSLTQLPRFDRCERLTSITIPDSITEIESCAFTFCTKLKSVKLPNSLTRIGGHAFSNCSSLAYITIPNSVNIIESGAFHGCFSLAYITIPNSVNIIESEAFESCGMAYITIPNSVNKIESGAFSYCSHLRFVIFPDNFNCDIDPKAFYNSKIDTVRMPHVFHSSFFSSNKVRKLQTTREAYEINKCQIPDHVIVEFIEDIENGVMVEDTYVMDEDGVAYFKDKDGVVFSADRKKLIKAPRGLEEYIIPEGTTTIGFKAFFDVADTLKFIIIPDSVIEIEPYAFRGNMTGPKKLPYIEVPKTVLKIGENAFANIGEIRYSGWAKGKPWGAGIVIQAQAYFSAGCFWGVEYYFKRLKGVAKTVVGFMGGDIEKPNYEQVKTGTTGHLETIEVSYDPEQVSYEALVRYFFEIHNFEQADGQGIDIGTQYISAIWYNNIKERDIAIHVSAELWQMGYRPVTQIRPVKPFYPAEDYHQDYLDQRQETPECHVYRKIFKEDKPSTHKK